MSIFLAFAAFWLVRGGSRSSLEVEFQKCDLPCGSRSFLEVEFEKCDLPCARRVALFSERQVSVLFSGDLAEI